MATIQMRSSVAARSAVRAARPSRAAVVVRAEARREVLAGFVAAGASLLAAGASQAAATGVDLFDDRKARKTGFDLIYEARDLDLDQSVRDGMTQARQNLDATVKRVKESEARIDAAVEPSIVKAYWTEAREELRRQLGTLRFDLNTLASTKGKEEKKKALALRKDFLRTVEDLDLALRKKDKDSALSKLVAVKTSLDTVLASVL